MRKIAVPLFCFSVLFAACSSTPRVNRIDAGTQTDLSGRWNDSDARQVSANLAQKLIAAPEFAAYIRNFQSRRSGRLPAVVVGAFSNATSEHIDTGILAYQMETALHRSGTVTVVAGGQLVTALRAEREDQMSWASDESALSLANETGANLMLTLAVRSITDRAGNRQVRSYFVNAELTDIETRTRVWMDADDSIKKEITRPGVRL